VNLKINKNTSLE